eukprot:TRINITY_DN5997_c0_g1_i3.p1 TRINITY_DN5997_c0_g1~~TRINITY_DN5997_c0_g1_i3.p1  ORF type:complete len:558 (+),score=87.48 TRINITY_DN5997_c0_g1_i3:61-1674(+)
MESGVTGGQALLVQEIVELDADESEEEELLHADDSEAVSPISLPPSEKARDRSCGGGSSVGTPHRMAHGSGHDASPPPRRRVVLLPRRPKGAILRPAPGAADLVAFSAGPQENRGRGVLRRRQSRSRSASCGSPMPSRSRSRSRVQQEADAGTHSAGERRTNATLRGRLESNGGGRNASHPRSRSRSRTPPARDTRCEETDNGGSSDTRWVAQQPSQPPPPPPPPPPASAPAVPAAVLREIGAEWGCQVPPPQHWGHVHAPPLHHQPAPCPQGSWEGWWMPHPWHVQPALPNSVTPAVPAHPAVAAPLATPGQGGAVVVEHAFLQRDKSGGFALVAEHVPPNLQKHDLLLGWFTKFGRVLSLQINGNRNEVVVSWDRIEPAEAALKAVTLDNTNITLRAWRRRPQQENETPQVWGNNVKSTPQPETEVQTRRMTLLKNLTDQMKAVMTKIGDPNTTERNREQLQALTGTIKEKIMALTPPPKTRTRYTLINHQNHQLINTSAKANTEEATEEREADAQDVTEAPNGLVASTGSTSSE